MRLLIVEHEVRMAALLERGLEGDGYVLAGADDYLTKPSRSASYRRDCGP
jgi:DNA-binding response OmpR family regulator